MNKENYVEKKELNDEYLTLSDGTDISELSYNSRKMLRTFCVREVKQWYLTLKTLNKLEEIEKRGEKLPINQGDYLFTDDLDGYFGYVLQIREEVRNNVLYKYLDVVVGRTIKTIRYNPKNFRDPVTRAIIDCYGIFFDEKTLFDRLIRIEVTNIIDYSDTVTFSKVKKFYIVCPEAEQALGECIELLIERKKNSNKQS